MIEQTKTSIAKQKRGQIDNSFLSAYYTFSTSQLIHLLNDISPRARTAVATILGEQRSEEAISALCKALQKEKALYSKIAISKALGNIGIKAIPELLKYVGKIGNNQHRELPMEVFKKWNYPLPRDLAIRTIIKMDTSALPILRKAIWDADNIIVTELIDAIGHISFYTRNQESLPTLLALFNKHKKQPIVIWKLLRALQAFHQQESVAILEKYFLESPIPELSWEAARSLGQLNAKAILLKGLNNPNGLVNEMIVLGVNHLVS